MDCRRQITVTWKIKKPISIMAKRQIKPNFFTDEEELKASIGKVDYFFLFFFSTTINDW